MEFTVRWHSTSLFPEGCMRMHDRNEVEINASSLLSAKRMATKIVNMDSRTVKAVREGWSDVFPLGFILPKDGDCEFITTNRTRQIDCKDGIKKHTWFCVIWKGEMYA